MLSTGSLAPMDIGALKTAQGKEFDSAEWYLSPSQAKGYYRRNKDKMLFQKRLIKILVLIFLFFWFGFFFLEKIDLSTADLGRHLENGRQILAGNFNVLRTNFYSYVNSEYPFANHHWLYGVIIFLIYKSAGFIGIHFFSFLLGAATFLLFFQAAKSRPATPLVFILSLLIIPLAAFRHEVRPELFSYFFLAAFYYLFSNFSVNKISLKKLLLFIIPLQILWANSHIYFFFGPVLAFVFLLEEILKKEKKSIKQFGLLFLILVFSSAVNPFGLRSLMYPFSIFENYGYRVLENQSIWFLENLGIHNPNYLMFKIIFPILILSFILVLWKKPERFSLANALLALGFSFMALFAIRNLSLFAFFALPIISQNLNVIMPKFSLKSADAKIGAASFALIVVITISALYGEQLALAKNDFGLGLKKGMNNSAEFFRDNKIKGPIFNNYDIGGYLIFHFFPDERIFVDNRPEAYPASFFEKTYIPMQENETIWQEKQKQYGFNAIFFSINDATPWAQKFLIERIKDPVWTPVFADEYIIIFVKRTEANQEIIEKYEIPKEKFNIL